MINTDHHIEIISFTDELAPEFAALNKAWLVKYFTIEPLDQQMLEDPRKYFIDTGGHIFFAKIDDAIAGTFALLKNGEQEYELAKMAVAEKFQGLKIGNLMLEFSIRKVRQDQAINTNGGSGFTKFLQAKLQDGVHVSHQYDR